MQVPAPFAYARATSVDQAIALLQQLGGAARLIAGGHSLLPMMKLRLAEVDHVIDINDLHDECGHIAVEATRVRLGALVRHRELLESAALTAVFPIVADAERVIADPVVRNRGTLGGSLCQADPAEDLTAVCAALDARCVIRGPAGERILTMAEFHRGPYETAVRDDEMLVEVHLPVRPHTGSAYAKVERRAGDWAIASAGAAVRLAEDGTIADARVALAAVGPNPGGVAGITELMRGSPPSEELYERAGALAADSCEPVTDTRGSSAYKRHLVAVLTRRTLRLAVARIHPKG